MYSVSGYMFVCPINLYGIFAYDITLKSISSKTVILNIVFRNISRSQSSSYSSSRKPSTLTVTITEVSLLNRVLRTNLYELGTMNVSDIIDKVIVDFLT